MGLFDFIKPAKTLESEIEKIEGFTITNRHNTKIIEIAKGVSLENIENLLQVLRIYKIAFAVYDSLYPSPSDPGAYLDYSQEKNEMENSWSMTLGNHGWTGGIYTIDEKIIAIQLKNLVDNKQIDSIRIENVRIFSHYPLKNKESNANISLQLLGIHSNINEVNSDYLIFGIFSSDSYNPYKIYKLTKNSLLVDNRQTWHSQRHTQNGYIFEGEVLNESKFIIANELLNKIPLKLLTLNWNGFYTTENKDEYKLIVSFSINNQQKTITIDSYENNLEYLPIEIKNFKTEVENIISKLEK